MEEQNEFETKEEYLKHIKELFYKQGLKCMVTSVIVLLLMFWLYESDQTILFLIPKGLFWFVQKATTVCFVIGAIAYLVSYFIIVRHN